MEGHEGGVKRGIEEGGGVPLEYWLVYFFAGRGGGCIIKSGIIITYHVVFFNIIIFIGYS